MVSPAIYWPPLLILIFLWIRADAKHRKVIVPCWVSLGITVLFPLGVPIYLARTYQLRPAIYRVGMFLLFATACVCAVLLGRKLAFYRYMYLV